MALKHPRFLLFLAVFAAAALMAAASRPVPEALVLGFDLGALVFLASCAPIWFSDNPEAIRARGARDDGGRVLLLIVSLIVLASVLIAIVMTIQERATLRAADVFVILGTLILAWLFANLVHAFHYAHCYYDPAGPVDARGLRFPATTEPLFADFCYFALVIGMTSQVSDVAIESRQMRRLATMHGLQAFFFNLGVLALTINVLSGAI